MIEVRCDGCGRTAQVKDEFLGKRMKCHCGHSTLVAAVAVPANPGPFYSAPQQAAGQVVMTEVDIPATSAAATGRGWQISMLIMSLVITSVGVALFVGAYFEVAFRPADATLRLQANKLGLEREQLKLQYQQFRLQFLAAQGSKPGQYDSPPSEPQSYSSDHYYLPGYSYGTMSIGAGLATLGVLCLLVLNSLRRSSP